MKKQLENKLFIKYPDLFRFKHEKNPRMAYPIISGIQCDDGWFNLIDSLCDKLNLIYKTVNIPIYVVQIKEKFGCLRFYITYIDETQIGLNIPKDLSTEKKWQEIIYSVISNACDKSAFTCEICGSTSAQTISFESGLIKTVCDEHLKWRRLASGQ